MYTSNSFRSILVKFLAIFVVLAVIAAAAIGGMRVLAQDGGPDGPVVSDAPSATPSAEQGDGLKEMDVPLVPLGSGGDGAPENLTSAIPGAFLPEPSSPDNALVSFSYFRLVGTAFNPRTTTTTFAYNFNGCIYETGGTDNRFMAPVLIPSGSVIKYLRLYYNDTAASDITAWLTRYQPGVTSEDLTSITSNGSTGYGTTLSPEITHTVDLTNWAYTVIIAPNANAATNSFCGVRVAYYAPLFGAVAMPMVIKTTP